MRDKQCLCGREGEGERERELAGRVVIMPTIGTCTSEELTQFANKGCSWLPNIAWSMMVTSSSRPTRERERERERVRSYVDHSKRDMCNSAEALV